MINSAAAAGLSGVDGGAGRLAFVLPGRGNECTLVGGNFEDALGKPRDIAHRVNHLLILDARGRDDRDGAQAVVAESSG